MNEQTTYKKKSICKKIWTLLQLNLHDMGMYVHVCSNTIVIKGLAWKSNYEIPAGSVHKVLVMFSILFQGFSYNVLATSSPSSHWHFLLWLQSLDKLHLNYYVLDDKFHS